MKVNVYIGKYIFLGDIEDIFVFIFIFMSWSREVIDYFIGLYEEKMEYFRRKKKDVWKIIIEGLNIVGFKFFQNQVEGKWKSLIVFYKVLWDNKIKIG